MIVNHLYQLLMCNVGLVDLNKPLLILIYYKTTTYDIEFQFLTVNG